MVDLLIGIAVIAVVVFGLRLFFRVIAKQEEEQKTSEAKALEDFCGEHGFKFLEDKDKRVYWQRIEPAYMVGVLGQLFTSETGIYPHMGIRETESGNEYAVLRRSGRHQSGGSRRYLVGAFLENGGFGLPELFIAPLSFLTGFFQQKKGWNRVGTMAPFRAYVRNGHLSGVPESKKEILLREMSRMGKPYLSLFSGSSGVFVYFEKMGKWPTSTDDYERVLSCAHRFKKILHGRSV